LYAQDGKSPLRLDDNKPERRFDEMELDTILGIVCKKTAILLFID
jgi:hypothetical protein